jgi:hypothetical protein
MDRDSVEVFLPDPDDCYERLRRARFGATVSCVYCGESEPVIKKGTTMRCVRPCSSGNVGEQQQKRIVRPTECSDTTGRAIAREVAVRARG